MKNDPDILTVGELKRTFSEVLREVRGGRTRAVSFGRGREPVALLIPYPSTTKPRELGTLAGKGRIEFHGDFSLADDELLQS